MPSAQMQAVIDFLKQRRVGREAGPARTLEESRERYAPAGQLRPIPEDVAVDALEASGVPVYSLTTPDTVTSEGAMLFLHGGGYSLGSLKSHGPLAAALGRATGRRIFFPEYRLAPEHPFPAAVDDTFGVWRWLVANGFNAGSMIVAGDSAGGGLVMALLHTLRDAGEPLPACAVLISPFLDLTTSGSSMIERADQDPIFTPEMILALAVTYLDGADPRHPTASPLFAPQAGLPPLLIQVGSAEVLLSDSERLADVAAKAGVHVMLQVAEGLPHVYHGALEAPEVIDAIHQIAEFARQF